MEYESFRCPQCDYQTKLVDDVKHDCADYQKRGFKVIAGMRMAGKSWQQKMNIEGIKIYLVTPNYENFQWWLKGSYVNTSIFDIVHVPNAEKLLGRIINDQDIVIFYNEKNFKYDDLIAIRKEIEFRKIKPTNRRKNDV